MSFTTWIDGRIQQAITTLAADLETQGSPVIQKLIDGLVAGLTKNSAWISQAAGQIAAAVTTGVVAQVTTSIEQIPQDTTQLLSSELNQLPQQVGEVLNMPVAIATAVTGALANLPQQMEAAVAQAIHGIIPFGEAAPVSPVKKASGSKK